MRRLILLTTLLLVPFGVAAADPATGRVTGRIDCRSADSCLGVAALWSAEKQLVPAPDRFVLVPAVAAGLTEDGSFELVAPVGDYYLGAQLRKTPGPVFGSPRIGDQLYLIKEQDRTGYRVTVVKDGVIDVGAHSASWTYAGLKGSVQMGISGQVLDSEQQPVAGLLVFAFADPGATTTPLAVSARSAADGSFVLPLALPGSVYLRAREKHRGGQAQANEFISLSSGPASPVIVEANKVTAAVQVLVRKLPSVLQMKNAPNTARPKID